MSPFGRWAACASLFIGALMPVAGPVAPVCAGEGPRAALVVDTGRGVHNFCVALPSDEVSGLELIVLAGEQHDLSYRFGYGGGAVCMLADVGASGDDCFERYPDFWGYWRGSSSGWTWSSAGAGSTSVGHGDVEGWSWGSGNDGNSHPRPPETSFSSVCPTSASSDTPPEKKEREEGPAQSPRPAALAPASDPVAPAPNAAGPAPDAPGATVKHAPKKRREPERRRDRGARKGSAIVQPEPTPSGGDLLASRELGAQREDGAVPPAAGVAALGAAALLGGAGFVFARRRRGAS